MRTCGGTSSCTVSPGCHQASGGMPQEGRRWGRDAAEAWRTCFMGTRCTSPHSIQHTAARASKTSSRRVLARHRVFGVNSSGLAASMDVYPMAGANGMAEPPWEGNAHLWRALTSGVIHRAARTLPKGNQAHRRSHREAWNDLGSSVADWRSSPSTLCGTSSVGSPTRRILAGWKPPQAKAVLEAVTEADMEGELEPQTSRGCAR